MKSPGFRRTKNLAIMKERWRFFLWALLLCRKPQKKKDKHLRFILVGMSQPAAHRSLPQHLLNHTKRLFSKIHYRKNSFGKSIKYYCFIRLVRQHKTRYGSFVGSFATGSVSKPRENSAEMVLGDRVGGRASSSDCKSNFTFFPKVSEQQY